MPRRDALPGNTVELQRILSRRAGMPESDWNSPRLDAGHFFDGGRRRAAPRRAEPSRAGGSAASRRHPVITTRARTDGQDDSARAWWTSALFFLFLSPTVLDKLNLTPPLIRPPRKTRDRDARKSRRDLCPRAFSSLAAYGICVGFFLRDVRDAIAR